MNRITMTKLFGAGCLSLSLAVAPLMLPAMAQNDASDTVAVVKDRDFDWGWLGLLGLIGLAGFAGGKSASDEGSARYRDPADPNVRDRPGTY